MKPRQMTFSSALAITAHFGVSVMRLVKVKLPMIRALPIMPIVLLIAPH
jgi:hypothetical protein